MKKDMKELALLAGVAAGIQKNASAAEAVGFSKEALDDAQLAALIGALGGTGVGGGLGYGAGKLLGINPKALGLIGAGLGGVGGGMAGHAYGKKDLTNADLAALIEAAGIKIPQLVPKKEAPANYVEKNPAPKAKASKRKDYVTR